ncbi:MAG: DUF4358 domain-containing protein [Lachnospiraceae bacterium]|nr:DUF4358 domain-containing protein [Lachnospiraceae bacterium]
MKKMKFLCALFMVAAISVGTLFGCGSKEAPEAKVDFETLQKDMLSTKDELPKMTTVSSKDDNGKELFTSLSDVEYDKVQDYFYSYATEGSASEVAVVFVKNEEDVKAMEESLKEHLQSRRSTYENYSPDQVEIADGAVVFSKGNYVCFIMNKELSHIKATFESAME